MGNCCCCQSKGPCDSAEETSLLQNDSKATVPTAETPGALSVGGTCGPGLEEDISKGQLNKDAETAYSAQENGTLQKSSLQTANKSPQHKVNSANAQSVDKHASTADSGDGGQQHSTLITPQKGHAQAGWEASKTTSAEEDKAVEEKKCPSETPAVVCTEPPCLSETNPKQEHSIMDAINNNKQECPVPLDICVERSSTEPEEVKEEEELPNAEPAAPHPQVLPISEINEEVNVVNTEPSISDDPESRSSPICVEADHEETQSHVPEPSVGSLGPGFDHSGPEGETAKPEPDTTVSAESQSLQQTEKCDPECPVKDTPHEIAAVSPNEDVKPEEEVPGVVCEGKPEETLEKAESAAPAVATVAEEVMVVREEQLAESAPAVVGGDTEPEETPMTAKEEAAEDRGNSEEDLYRGAEELSCDLTTTSAAASENSLRSEDRCSLAPAVDILSYSEREWKGNTAKSALIRKGYKEMSHKFSGVRRVRGDNYCALRATLYQVLCHTTQMPEWLQEEGVATLPKELEAREGLISQWIFPGECLLHEDGTLDATQQLQGYIELLREKWQAAVACASSSERQQLCEQWFQGGEQELGLMEALKVLMLARAVELHSSIQQGDDPPLFCWLLFARDSSDCPRSFLNNHLSHVGLSAGLEQVEMFLLGYALQCTIQVYRLYKADTEEFVTFYPDDHKDEWPCVCLVTEDDRHYNVPVLLDATEPPKELKSS